MNVFNKLRQNGSVSSEDWKSIPGFDLECSNFEGNINVPNNIYLNLLRNYKIGLENNDPENLRTKLNFPVN